jgi:hypothetical protein
VFNRVQENMIRGGAETVTGEGRHVSTKGIGRIERDVQVNAALWRLAVESVKKHGTPPTKARAKKVLSESEVLE